MRLTCRYWVGLLLMSQSLAFGNHPPPGSVHIRDIQHTGTGCPAGSVASHLAPDTETLTLLFDRYVVDNSASPSGSAQKNCRVSLDIETPQRYQFALYRIDYRGYVGLEEGASGHQSSAYSFGTSPNRTLLTPLDLKGPLDDDYNHSVVIPISAAEFSRCGDGGGNLIHIDTVVKVDARSPKRQISLASGGARYNETNLGQTIQDMNLIQKQSASPCQKGRTFGFSGSKAWVNLGCRGVFEVSFAGGGNAAAKGVMTVDSLDGYVNQEYGIEWKHCEPGRWVQTDGQSCQDVCRRQGMAAAKDPGGASCVSGEARPTSAIGQVSFVKGCWGACTPMGDIQTESVGPFCYHAGQKRDADKTDRTVGCYCR
jgi:hypothetical protein